VLFRILLKFVGCPLEDALKYEQELIVAKRTKTRNSGFMKPAKLQFLGKKRK
jgi:hypothetical protein